MAGVNYVALLGTVQQLIAQNGRQVTFVRLDRSPADASKPWRSSPDPRAALDASVVVDVVQADPTSLEDLGFSSEEQESVDRDSRTYLCAPPVGGQLLDTFDEVLDGGERFKITKVDVLQPAATRMLYIARCSR